MAQTKRSLAQIYALLADNSTGAISETDLRDAIATVHMGHGEIYITSSAETTIPDTETYVQAAGTYALTDGVLAVSWDMNVSARLRYTGTPDRVVHVAASFSIVSAGNNKIYSLAVAKNGTVIAPSRVEFKLSTGADVHTGAMHGLINVSTNDYLTVVIRGDTDSTNATLSTTNLFATDMPL